MLTGEKID